MAFGIPNEGDAFHADQAEPDAGDIAILVAGLNGNGVVSGCAVTAQGTPDMTGAVAAGTIRNADGTTAAVSAGNVTFTTADATNPRFDLVVASNAGVKSVTAGTAAASPVFPAIPATSVVLAAVYVPANDTTIAANQITDKRVMLDAPYYGQAVLYPHAFSGDTINGSSASPFVDVAAFDTKEVLNSRVLHLRSLGASKDHKVRVTLGTTKAGAFDVRVAVAWSGLMWSNADDNAYADVRLATSADAQIAVCRLQTWATNTMMGSPVIYQPLVQPKFGGSTVAAQADNVAPFVGLGEVATIRFVRDGSNVISYSVAPGLAPLALVSPRVRSNLIPYTQTVSGTLERIEFVIHTPTTGPGATVEHDLWIDYLQSV